MSFNSQAVMVKEIVNVSFPGMVISGTEALYIKITGDSSNMHGHFFYQCLLKKRNAKKFKKFSFDRTCAFNNTLIEFS